MPAVLECEAYQVSTQNGEFSLEYHISSASYGVVCLIASFCRYNLDAYNSISGVSSSSSASNPTS